MAGLAGRRLRDQETRLAEGEEVDNRRQALVEALTVLNDRERRIFEARRLADDPITLEELADEFGVSRERVRQIEVRAFEKVQKAVKNRVAAMEAPPVVPSAHGHGRALNGMRSERELDDGVPVPTGTPFACWAARRVRCHSLPFHSAANLSQNA